MIDPDIVELRKIARRRAKEFAEECAAKRHVVVIDGKDADIYFTEDMTEEERHQMAAWLVRSKIASYVIRVEDLPR